MVRECSGLRNSCFVPSGEGTGHFTTCPHLPGPNRVKQWGGGLDFKTILPGLTWESPWWFEKCLAVSFHLRPPGGKVQGQDLKERCKSCLFSSYFLKGQRGSESSELSLLWDVQNFPWWWWQVLHRSRHPAPSFIRLLPPRRARLKAPDDHRNEKIC